MINIVDDIMLMIGSAIIFIWGIAHVILTGYILKRLPDISEDSRSIIAQGWLAHGLTLCFIGVLVFLVLMLYGTEDVAARLIYWAAAVMLLVMAVLSLSMGARTTIMPVKICPLLKTVVAIVFILAITAFA